jgi:hypothetical protein
MPYQFQFKVNDKTQFKCNIQSEQCVAHSKSGAQCKRNVAIGTPYCYQHLETEKHLKIKQSTVPNAGKGLFASDATKPARAVVFKKGSLIVAYGGEYLNEKQLTKRYGEYTAPYAAQLKKNVVQDCACIRDVGALANHSGNKAAVNAKLYGAYTSKPQQIRLAATRDIKNGDEILLDYGNEYRFDEAEAEHSTKYVR